MSWNPVEMDLGILEAAWIIQDQFGYSWWDALIVSSAQRVGCRYLVTEDMQHGQEIEALTIIDPFVLSPDLLGQ